MDLDEFLDGEFAARARREDRAAERSASPEARMAHRELARLCRARAVEMRWFDGLGAATDV